MKADMLPEVWVEFMIQNPRWWAVKPSLAYAKPCPVLTMVAEFFMRQRYGVWKPSNRVSHSP
jgi:hypothetical protein